ncbi:hypothetical protein PAMP_001999 [Pampus punctatissimus]
MELTSSCCWKPERHMLRGRQDWRKTLECVKTDAADRMKSSVLTYESPKCPHSKGETPGLTAGKVDSQQQD